MPRSVTAILVAADDPEHLPPTLSAVLRQTRPADRLVVAQTGVLEVTAGAVSAARPDAVVRVPPRSGFGTALQAGAAGLPGSGVEDEEWLWLLSSDNAPAPDALERLLDAVERSPSVVIAGPKQMQWDAPEYLHSFGETMTRFGTAVEVVEPELDQAQHDATSDVLGVAAGGMLVRGALWRELGGFDPGLPVVDDALDFCVRARLAGHRVQLVPAARVLAAGSDGDGAHLLGAAASIGRRARFKREAQLHRRLVYSPLALLPLHWLSIVPFGVARAVGELLRKHPEAAPGELLAALTVAGTCFGRVHRSRRRLAGSRTASWSAVAPLRLPWSEVRRRRSLLRENGRPLRRRTPLHFFSGGGLATVLAVAAFSFLVHWPLLGAPALTGGALLPLGGLHSLWESVGWGHHPVGVGFTGPADPFAMVLAVLGTLTPWHPSAAVVALWVAGLPLAALGGWLLAAEFTRRPVLRVVGGLLWAFAPALLLAEDTGRVGAVLAHLALPFAALAALRVRRSWTASATLALLGALIAASAPSLLPLLVGTWIAAVAAARAVPLPGSRSRTARIVALPLPTLVLFLPLLAVQTLRGSPLAVLADPGPVVVPAPAHGVLGLPEPIGLLLQLASGWPAWAGTAWNGLAEPLGATGPAAALVTWALGAPVLLLAAAGLVWPKRGLPVRMAAVAATGLVAAALATRLQLLADGATPVALWAGAGVSIAWLGVAGAAVFGLDRLSAAADLPFHDPVSRAVSHTRAASAGVVGLAAAAALVTAVAPLLGGALLGTSAVRITTGATVPALVAAEAQQAPHLGLLTLAVQPDGGVRQRLTRGTGATLEQSSTLATTGSSGDSAQLFRLAGALVQPSGDDVTVALRRLEIGYVLLSPSSTGLGGAAARASAASALGSNPVLSTVSTTGAGTLYRWSGAPNGLGTTPVRGPATSPLGPVVFAVQLLVLLLTLLLALPTRRIAARVRPDQVFRAPAADVSGTRGAAGADLRGRSSMERAAQVESPVHVIAPGGSAAARGTVDSDAAGRRRDHERVPV